jgi:hypothetical protein
MQAKELAKTALESTQYLLNMYLNDLSDADLLVRPVPNANYIGWQLAHLIASEKGMMAELLPGVQYPELPTALVTFGDTKTATQPASAPFTKAQYLEWFGKVRGATLAAVGKLSDSDLDRPTTGPMAQFAPNLGAMLILLANHTLMHGGQFSVVRRALSKPVIF